MENNETSKETLTENIILPLSPALLEMVEKERQILTEELGLTLSRQDVIRRIIKLSLS